jgi:hypothetical protein
MRTLPRVLVHDTKEHTMETLSARSVEEWLAAFPTRDAQEQLAELRERRASIDAQISQLERLIDALGLAAGAVNGNSNGNHAALSDAPQGMDAVEMVMRARPGVWARHEIGAALVERGWLAEGESGTGTLGSIMYRMVKRGRVVRLDGGRYRLPDNREVQSPC